MNCKKIFYEKILKQFSDKCYQKTISTFPKIFISILISLLFCDEITSGEPFSREDKDRRLRLTTLSFKCYNCYFKGCYSSKTVFCCGTTLRREGLMQQKREKVEGIENFLKFQSFRFQVQSKIENLETQEMDIFSSQTTL